MGVHCDVDARRIEAAVLMEDTSCSRSMQCFAAACAFQNLKNAFLHHEIIAESEVIDSYQRDYHIDYV